VSPAPQAPLVVWALTFEGPRANGDDWGYSSAGVFSTPERAMRAAEHIAKGIAWKPAHTDPVGELYCYDGWVDDQRRYCIVREVVDEDA
jgi:hypothetical protein